MGQHFRGCLYNAKTYMWHRKDDQGWPMRGWGGKSWSVGGGLIDELAPVTVSLHLYKLS